MEKIRKTNEILTELHKNHARLLFYLSKNNTNLYDNVIKTLQKTENDLKNELDEVKLNKNA